MSKIAEIEKIVNDFLFEPADDLQRVLEQNFPKDPISISCSESGRCVVRVGDLVCTIKPVVEPAS